MNLSELSQLFIPLLVLGIIGYALYRKVNVFDEFVDGAKEGLQLGFSVFPCLIAMIFGINILLKSELLNHIFLFLEPLFSFLRVPVEILPMALIRPISGNASFAVMIDIFKTYGVDSYLGRIAAVMQGATDTTIYVLSLYFGSIGIKNIRYALKAGLFADFVTLVMSILLVMCVFGS